MSKMSDGGKGSAPRPFNINQDEYEKRWDAIFQRDLKEEKVHDESKSSSGDTDNRESGTK
jgi:hypothetical protein